MDFSGLNIAILIEVGIIAMCFVFVLWHAAATNANTVRARPQLDRSNHIVNTFLTSQTISKADRRWVGSFSVRKRVALFSRFAGIFEGEELLRIHELAELTGLVKVAKRRCRSRLWARRLEGARLFTAIGGGHENVLPLFHDPHEEVRAGAAEWAASHPDDDVINNLLPLLSDESGFCLFVVKDSFIRLGSTAATALLGYLESHDDPSEDAIEVATWISDARLLPTGLRLKSHPTPSKRAAALALLASIGGPDALTAATDALQDDEVTVRIAALNALARIGHWSVTSAVAKALRDPEWNVRFAAATTLHSLGAPGILSLRRALRDEDQFAADMARHILDVSNTMAERTA